VVLAVLTGNVLYSAEFHYDLDFKSNRLKNVAMPTAPFDAANKLYVDSKPGETSGWTDDGPVVRLTNPFDSVRIGITNDAFGKLYVTTPMSNAVVASCMTNAVVGYAKDYAGVRGISLNTVGVFAEAINNAVYADASEYYGVWGIANKYGVYGKGKIGYGVYGNTGGDNGVYGTAGNYGVRGYGRDNYGVYGGADNYGVYGNAGNNIGVYGAADNYGVFGNGRDTYGVYGNSKKYGVYGKAGNYGVYGAARNYGVYGYAVYNYGVYGMASNRYGVAGYAVQGRGVYGYSEENYGAYFDSGSGNAVFCNGNIRMASGHNIYRGGSYKAFEIDHPLDPENKVLRHFCAEGPEALVMYSGSAVLDDTGEVTVTLPDYFDALSRNPRVQVTPVGSASAIGIKQRMTGNTFIVVGPPGTEFDWLVLAERDDRQARMERIYRPVEQVKTGMKRAVY
jgi:hypothetical protein